MFILQMVMIFVGIIDRINIAVLMLSLLVTVVSSEGLATMIIDKQITIRPIVICEGGGTNCVSPDFVQYEAFSDKIWGQAGIDIYFETTSQYNKSFDLTIDYTELTPADPSNEASFFSSALGGSADPSIINVWFSNNLVSDFFGTLLGVTNMEYVANPAFNNFYFGGYEPSLS